MKKILLFLSFPLALALFAAGINDFTAGAADAARFGRGGSFGSRPSFSRSAPAPQQSVRQAAPGQTAGAAARTGMGGLFGTLLAGSLLGALIFGGGFHGFGMVDIALILLAVFLITRFLRQRREQAAAAEAGRGFSRDSGHGALGGDAWDGLRSGQREDSSGQARQARGVRTPVGFNVDEFLTGAKMMYTRMQESWDKRDLDDIAAFASPAVLDEIRRQAAADPNPSRTDLLLINASLAGFEQSQDEDLATVFFDVYLRENPGENPRQARELWHFARRPGGNWALDGIQQVY